MSMCCCGCFRPRHSQQILKKRFGEDVVQPLSVDRNNDAYLALKETIYERRLACYFYPSLSVELRQLQISPRTGKVDHVSRGSKDVADALAGAVFNAVKEFDKGLMDEVQFGTFEDDDADLSEEEVLDKRLTAWLMGEGKLESPEADKPIIGKKRTVLTVSEINRGK
ncbi:hypothetical protein ES703_119000 [subsurface metagenome]